MYCPHYATTAFATSRSRCSNMATVHISHDYSHLSLHFSSTLCVTSGEYGFHHITLEWHIVLYVVVLRWVQLQQRHLSHVHVVVLSQDCSVDVLLDLIMAPVRVWNVTAWPVAAPIAVCLRLHGFRTLPILRKGDLISPCDDTFIHKQNKSFLLVLSLKQRL